MYFQTGRPLATRLSGGISNDHCYCTVDCSRFINARRRIVQPIIDDSNRIGLINECFGYLLHNLCESVYIINLTRCKLKELEHYHQEVVRLFSLVHN